MDDHLIDNIQYHQWTQTDRSSLITVVQPVEEFLDSFIDILQTLKCHDYIAKVQNSFLNQLKTVLRPEEYVVIADFSENYKCIVQDAVQSYHWNSTYATLHPFLCYYQDNGQLHHTCFVVVSENTDHNTIAVHLFQKKLIEFLSITFRKPKKIFYFSDGCAAQYKNRKNFINLCHHAEDFNVLAEWHFFATSHGKTAADSVAGTLKRMAAKASLQRPNEDQILNAKKLYEFASNEIAGMSFCFVTNEEHNEEEKILQARFLKSKTLPGTQKYHCFKPLNTTMVEVKQYSAAEQKYNKRKMKNATS